MSNQLFIEEDEDTNIVADPEINISPDHEEDPIIESIPIVLNDISSDQNNKFQVIQYPGRQKNRPLQGNFYKASVKTVTNFLEVKMPLDTTKFFNGHKIDDWGEDIGEQTLNGVLNKTEGGLYAAKIIKQDGHKKIVLVPIDSTAQLRASFKYIDDVDANNQAQRKAEATDTTKSTNIQILQTASKSGAQITHGDGFGNALGESLKHIKKFEEEEWAGLKWESADGTMATSIRQEAFLNAPDSELITESDLMSYVDDLTRS
ncbi:uncharacterized protein RJT21DRAFT_120649 [Scheffersomyces amazonensis]|uniref:uncharacterized protein n=1 Tax=Scheffersomyces amazonensis TaxID=1078765 RepID=UPI00315D29D4